MKRKNVLLDLDGTLTDSCEGILKSVKAVLRHYGAEIPSDEELHKFIGPPLRETFPQYGVPAEEIEEAIRLYRSRYFTVGKFENHPYDGITELLRQLTDEGMRLYVATTKPEDLAVEILNHFGLSRYFERIFGASMDRSSEGKGKIIARLLETVQISPEDCIMVGDTAFDVVGAKENGIPAVGVSWGYGQIGEMTDAGAVAIVESPQELLAFLTKE